jgi:hypothetical protein
VFVARASLKEAPRDIDAMAEVEFQEAMKKNQIPPEEHQKVRTQLRERLMAQEQVVPPGYMRMWTIDLGLRKRLLRDEPLFIRTKFYAAQTNASGTYMGVWQIGPPDKYPAVSLSMAGDSFHEFPVSANRLDENGKLIIRFINQNDSALLFPLDEGLEVLYRDGGFGLNFIRGMVIILCWLALLSAIGLSAASFLSFPVAAFFAATLLVIGLSSGTLSSVVAEGTLGAIDHESGTGNVTLVDRIVMPVFSKLLVVVNLVQGFSPVDSLSTGRSITWGQLGLAFSQIVLLLGGIFAAIGIATFTRRELATAQTGS